MTSHINFRTILDNCKLTGPNFIGWYRNMRILLKAENLMYTIEESLPVKPGADAPAEEQEAWKKHKRDDDVAVCVMLASMSPELQRQYDNMGASTIIVHLNELFAEQARNESLESSRLLFSTKM